MSNKAERDQIVALKTDGITWNENVKPLKVCRKTVYNAREQFQELGKTSGKSISGRTRTVFTQTMTFATKKKIEQNPHRETSENGKICWILKIFNAMGNYGSPTVNSI